MSVHSSSVTPPNFQMSTPNPPSTGERVSLRTPATETQNPITPPAATEINLTDQHVGPGRTLPSDTSEPNALNFAPFLEARAEAGEPGQVSGTDSESPEIEGKIIVADPGVGKYYEFLDQQQREALQNEAAPGEPDNRSQLQIRQDIQSQIDEIKNGLADGSLTAEPQGHVTAVLKGGQQQIFDAINTLNANQASSGASTGDEQLKSDLRNMARLYDMQASPELSARLSQLMEALNNIR